MLKNLFIYLEGDILINKKIIHSIISLLKKDFKLTLTSLEINFVKSETILKINKEYLNHDYVTDVISFNYSNENNNLDGEIFICSEIARENAKIYNESYDDELKRLIIHGVLHLIGYDDKKLTQRNKMKQIEDLYVIKAKKLGKIIK